MGKKFKSNNETHFFPTTVSRTHHSSCYTHGQKNAHRRAKPIYMQHTKLRIFALSWKERTNKNSFDTITSHQCPASFFFTLGIIEARGRNLRESNIISRTHRVRLFIGIKWSLRMKPCRTQSRLVNALRFCWKSEGNKNGSQKTKVIGTRSCILNASRCRFKIGDFCVMAVIIVRAFLLSALLFEVFCVLGYT